MADPFVAEIRIFPFNFAPVGWAFCNGQILPLSQNTALFSLLGTNYGGDGKSTFALPNLQGNVPLQQGQGSGLSNTYLGETGGSETVTLIDSEMPAHSHAPQVNKSVVADTATAQGNVIAKSVYDDGQGNTGAVSTFSGQAPTVQLAPQALTVAGGSQPHNNLQPYLTLNFCIALQGVYPPRS